MQTEQTLQQTLKMMEVDMHKIDWTTATESGTDYVIIDAKDVSSANADPVAFAELVLRIENIQTATITEQGE